MSLNNLKEQKTLNIFCHSEKAGVLRRTDLGCEFEFSANFIQKKRKLSFHMSYNDSPIKYRGDNLPPFFAGLLPEGLRLKTLIQKIKTSDDDLFSVLAAIGSHCVGDIYVKNDQPITQTTLNKFKDTDFYSLFKSNMSASEIHSKDESFAGVQEKISASMINFPLNIAKNNKSYILKLNPKDKPRLVENEWTSLELAKKCGLIVNKAKLVSDTNNNLGLLVERFDRYVKDGKVNMLHQEDACQFLNRYPADKYRLSFKEVCDGVNQYATAPRIEILKLIQLYAFSYLIGNGDLHAKNISLQVLKPSGKVVLTPNYDLLATYIHKDHKMALKINGRDDNIKRKDFINFGELFYVPAKSVDTMLNKLIISLEKHHSIMHQFMNEKQSKQWLTMFKKRVLDLKAEPS